jgi:hypothetical protein
MNGFFIAITVPVIFSRKHAGFQGRCRIGRALPGGGKTRPGGKRRILDSRNLPVLRQDFSSFQKRRLSKVKNLLNLSHYPHPVLFSGEKLS